MSRAAAGAARLAREGSTLWGVSLADALAGVGVLHPLTMVIYWFECRPEVAGVSTMWAFVAFRVRAGFSPAMWPMTGIFAVMGATLGLAAGWTTRALTLRRRQVDEHLHEIQTLRELLPICAWCKKIRDDHGYWQQLEGYLTNRKIAHFSHGVCPDCADKLAAECG